MFEFFKNSITAKVERQRKIEGQINVLKKQQKVSAEQLIQEFNCKKEAFDNSVDAQVNALLAQVKTLKAQKGAQRQFYDQQLKVNMDKRLNDFDRKIVSKQNASKRLGHLIEAEQQNMQDVLNPDKPNAPADRRPIGFTLDNSDKKLLVEEKKSKDKK